MESNHEDAYEQLDAVISTWSSQVQDSQSAIAERIASAHGQLSDILERTSHSNGHANPTAKAAPETGDSAARLAELEAALAAAQAEIDAFREGADETSATPPPPEPDHSEEIAFLRNALATADRRNTELEAKLALADTRAQSAEDALLLATAEKDRVVAERIELESHYADAKNQLAALQAPEAGVFETSEAAVDFDAAIDAEQAIASAEDAVAAPTATMETAVALATSEPPPPVLEAVADNARARSDSRQRLGDMLVAAGILTPEQLEGMLSAQASAPHKRLGSLVIEAGYTSESVIANLLAAQLRLPFIDLDTTPPDADAFTAISRHIATLHRAVPIKKARGILTVAMANPLNLIAIEDIEIASQLRVEPVVATHSAVERSLAQLYPTN